MKKQKSSIAKKPPEKRRKSLARARRGSGKAKANVDSLEWREAETARLLVAAKSKLSELKALLASASDHWGYEDPIYRFYHASFKVVRAQTGTLKIVEALQALAPHLKLNPDFLEIVAEGTGKQFLPSHKVNSPKSPRAMIEAFFHARHMLLMLCKYAEELPEAPPVLPSGWATVLYLYNIR
jgi:hypothetical protein